MASAGYAEINIEPIASPYLVIDAKAFGKNTQVRNTQHRKD